MAVHRLQIRLQIALFGSQFLEISVGIGIGGVHLVQSSLCGFNGFDRFFDIAAHVLRRVKLRFLGEEADLDAGLRTGFTENIAIEAGHDAQQGRFAGAVQAEDADFCAGEERQGDVLENFPLGRHDFAHAVHGVDVLGHGGSLVGWLASGGQSNH